MPAESPGRPSSRVLLALLAAVAVASGGLLIAAIAGRGSDGEGPVAVVEQRKSPFRGPRADDVAVVAVSVDPRGDTAEAVRRDTHAERGDHSASIWMVDAEGRIRTKYSAGSRVSPEDVAHDLMVPLSEADGAGAAGGGGP